MSDSTVVLLCNCSYRDVLPDEVKRAVRSQLEASGVEFEVVPDVCGLAARKDPYLKEVAAAPEVRIAACYPRAVRWLFHAGGAPLPEKQAKIYNLREQGAEEVAAGLLAGLPSATAKAVKQTKSSMELGDSPPDDWVPWYPVIDYERCQNCKQCLGFCLFGVFGLDVAGRVEVKQPGNCKTGCPACARVCPEAAIMFPRYNKAPVNGAEVSADDIRREPVQVNVGALVGSGDVYAALRARGKVGSTRPLPDPDALVRRPVSVEHLHALQEQLDIPDEVLRNLPGGAPEKAANPEADETGRGCSCRSAGGTARDVGGG